LRKSLDMKLERELLQRDTLPLRPLPKELHHPRYKRISPRIGPSSQTMMFFTKSKFSAKIYLIKPQRRLMLLSSRELLKALHFQMKIERSQQFFTELLSLLLIKIALESSPGTRL
jgi:hypothetical protein